MESAGAPPEFGRFFLPGPTEVRPEILAAMVRPMIPHRGKAFEELFASIQRGLRVVFQTERPVYVSSSSATGFMEGAVRCAPAGPVLSLVNGAFAERFADVARSCGRDVDVVDVAPGEVPDPDETRRHLDRRRYAAVTVVHSETSTGALADVHAISDAAHDAGAVCLVDSVTGALGTPLHVDRWSLDFMFTGSQKALALPPGLALGVAGESFVRVAATLPDRGRYFDLVEFETYAGKNQTPNTPALPLLYALDAQLRRIVAETVEARWERHRAMAERTYRWVAEQRERFGIGILAREGSRSPTVTAVTLPAGVTGADVVRRVAAHGYTVGGGYGRMRETTFRIGHMGDHTLDGLEGCLAACAEALGEGAG